MKKGRWGVRLRTKAVKEYSKHLVDAKISGEEATKRIIAFATGWNMAFDQLRRYRIYVVKKENVGSLTRKSSRRQI